ncbi:hypothetical protein N836_03625 [Leptolyngbya sp. Heron Island J]|uniref:DUF5615 family PIN-like protein n=1 Tax=Leptolyngbya sp. Heron Island J TaxID=1385935 RepID=UPI0003B9EC68|nr:DUF5615 family PIN-like protein [Leptolyngbya sp. Heron Island J]ESA37337.1 hypothetical protein N836_03625 [Leptolyngbya sp. Heron Island J]
MSDIFIHVYLDEDVDVLISNLLRSRGFNATTTTQAGQRGKSDAEQLEFATGLGAAILTHNRTDFESLAQEYFKTNKSHSGIIIAVRRPYTEIVRRLLTILDSTTSDEMENQILYI